MILVQIKRVMEKDIQGIDRQIYPETHFKAVFGLEEELLAIQVASTTGATQAYVNLKSEDALKKAKIYIDKSLETLNGSQIDYELPIASSNIIGGIMVGNGLSINDYGALSADKQTDNNFTNDEKSKLSSLKKLMAGANISISDQGVISATGGSGSSGDVNQEYVDQKAADTLVAAKAYAYSKEEVNTIVENIALFEKIGEV